MDQHDNVLQFNICLKEMELENLLSHKDQVVSEKRTGDNQRAPLKERNVNKAEIHFLNHQYKVFKENTNIVFRRGPVPPFAPQMRGNITRKDNSSNTQQIPYPSDNDCNLKKLLQTNFPSVKIKNSPYDLFLRKLDSVEFHLNESRKQRERLLTAIQRQQCNALVFTRMHREEDKTPNCCRRESTVQDLYLIINSATDVIQSTAIETNLYRGMILLIGNNCDSLDAYSSMTWRVMLKELDETIDDVMVLLNEFIRSSQSLTRFEEFQKHNELLAGIDALITCVRCCASYTWAMESRIATAAAAIGSRKADPEKCRDININIGSV